MTTHKPLLTLSLIIQILVGYKMNWAKHSCSKHGNHLFSLWLDMFLSSLLQKCLLSSRGRSYASVCRWLLKRSVGFWRRWRLNTRPRSPVPTRGSNIATGCWTSRWKQRRIYTVRFFFYSITAGIDFILLLVFSQIDCLVVWSIKCQRMVKMTSPSVHNPKIFRLQSIHNLSKWVRVNLIVDT